YAQLATSEIGDRKPSDTDEQFFYKTRKKALGSFKKRLWGLPAETRAAMGRALEDKFHFLLQTLRANGTREIADRFAPFVHGSFPAAGDAVSAGRGPEDVTGLQD